MLNSFFNFMHTECAVVATLSEKVAWIDYQQGVRSLYTAHLPEFKPVLIEQCDISENKTLLAPTLSPAGNYISYIRKIINDDGSTKEMLIVVNITTRSNCLVSLAPGSNVCFHEAQKQMFYVPHHAPNTVVAVSLTDSQSHELWQTQGSITNLALCEGCNKLAAVCKKQTRSSIALYDIIKNTYQWVNPSFDVDVSPVWSPDGKHLIFKRLHLFKSDTHYSLPKSDAPAFSLMLYACNTKKITSLWCSKSSIISQLSSQEGSRPVMWVDNETIVFCHEGSGWEHAYCLNIFEKKLTTLTKGDFLVRDLSVCRTTKTLYLVTNQKKRQYYHLKQISLNKNNPDYLIETPFSNASEISNNMCFSPQVLGEQGRYLLYFCTSVSNPCTLCIADKLTDKYIFPNRDGPKRFSYTTDEKLNTHRKPTLHFINSADGKICYGQLFTPANLTAHAAIIYLHDGPNKQSLPGFQPCLEMSFDYALCQYFVSKGFVVFDLNYRGSGGYSKGFREAKNRSWNGASEYKDVLAAGKWLASQPFVNANQLGIIGKGWGGYLVALGLARDSKLFHAGVDINGYHHLPRMMRTLNHIQDNNNMMFSCIEAETATRHIAQSKLALEYSPWDCIEDWMSPVLLINSGNNLQVPFSEGQTLYNALVHQGVQTESLVIPAETHTFTYHNSWREVAKASSSFFDRHLRKNHIP